MSNGLLSDSVSGIMGLGFQTISALNTTPFWQSIDNKNMLSSPVFSFYLERNDIQQSNTAPGGTFTLGGTNTSLYSGNIEFIDMPSGTTPSYWLQQVQSGLFQIYPYLWALIALLFFSRDSPGQVNLHFK